MVLAIDTIYTILSGLWVSLESSRVTLTRKTEEGNFKKEKEK